MILLIPLIIVVGLYFGVHELQEHVHAEEAQQHSEQHVSPSQSSSPNTPPATTSDQHNQ